MRKDNNKKGLWTVFAVLAGAALLCILYVSLTKDAQTPSKKKDEAQAPQQSQTVKEDTQDATEGIIQKKIITPPDIDYKNLQKDENLKSLMESRKQRLGIKQSLDMIVESQEQFKVGENKVIMGDILKKAFVKKGDVYQEKIAPSGEVVPQKTKEYGIYVVQPGDNIWNIHFNILKEYYEHRGISLSAKADEPVNQGMSSGVGKILKFSEKMVIIYNLADKKLASNIDLIEPLSKIVVYNMDEVFSLLQEVNYENIDRLQFDGTSIWIPARKQ